MKYRKIYHIITVLTGLLFLNTCTKDVDFNQIDDLEINPIVESSIIYFNAPASQFYNNGEITVTQDFVLVDIFNNSITLDYLTKAEFTFESTNSINREFQLQMDFVDQNDIIQYSVILSAPPSPTNADIVTEQFVVFEGNALLALKSTVKIEFTITLLSGNPINQNTVGDIQLKSKGLFYFTINNTL
jgi:hypothetical protein